MKDGNCTYCWDSRALEIYICVQKKWDGDWIVRLGNGAFIIGRND
jgi:hypothetical protein